MSAYEVTIFFFFFFWGGGGGGGELGGGGDIRLAIGPLAINFSHGLLRRSTRRKIKLDTYM